MNSLLIITNNPQRPSYRQRIEAFLPSLQAVGLSVQVMKLPDGKLRRWKKLNTASRYDTVLLHKACLNIFDAAVLHRSAVRIVYDFDDAVMYSPTRPDDDRSSHFRLFKRTVRMADTIIAGNDYLAEHARRFCASVHVLPTGLDTAPYRSAESPRSDDKLRLAWIGSRSTLGYLQELCPVIDAAAEHHPSLVLRVIADAFPMLQKAPLERHAWTLETQVSDLLACDVGLAPLPDNRFTRGKCGFKILQYFAAGVPVIASPVGVNSDLIARSGAGLLADTPDQWQAAIETLAADPALRKEMGQKARDYVTQYDLAQLADRFCRIVKGQH